MGLKQATKSTHLRAWPKKWGQLNKDFGTFFEEVTSLLWKYGIPIDTLKHLSLFQIKYKKI